MFDFDRDYQVFDRVQTATRTLPGMLGDRGPLVEIITKASNHECHCQLEFEAGTTGDKGKQTRTYLRFEDQGCTQMGIRVDGGKMSDCDKLEIFFDCGDELVALKTALTFMLKTLNEVQ